MLVWGFCCRVSPLSCPSLLFPGVVPPRVTLFLGVFAENVFALQQWCNDRFPEAAESLNGLYREVRVSLCPSWYWRQA